MSILTVKKRLHGSLVQSVEKAQAEGRLPRVPIPEFGLEHPQRAEHGDIATSLPLKLARGMGRNPIDIAREIITGMGEAGDYCDIEIAPPGFINFSLSNDWLHSQVERIVSSGQTWARLDIGNGEKIQIEFVSVNPTGPLHVGHGRGAVLGSTLANIMETCGFEVSREYYINDAGSQIDSFKRSLWVRYQQVLGRDVDMPQEGYFGNYMADLARQIIEIAGNKYLDMTEQSAVNELGEIGLEYMIKTIRDELSALRVEFDVWFSERTLYSSGDFMEAVRLLETGGYLVEKEYATWFTSTALGDSKDNVVIRSDGSPTYFAADIAYHYNKFKNRGFQTVVDIWGADHQGHISRMKAVMSALGIDPDRLSIIISQMVTLKRGGELVRLSKRSGELVTLKEVVDEVGADACRYFFLSRSSDSQMDFDLELAKKESADNPVYYIQYAHARISSILRLADDESIDYQQGNSALLTDPAELDLIRKMIQLPEVIEMVAKTLEPHHLAYFAQELATLFHSFYKQCRVVQRDAPELTRARLKLVVAAKTVFSHALGLMGMNVPESM